MSSHYLQYSLMRNKKYRFSIPIFRLKFIELHLRAADVLPYVPIVPVYNVIICSWSGGFHLYDEVMF